MRSKFPANKRFVIGLGILILACVGFIFFSFENIEFDTVSSSIKISKKRGVFIKQLNAVPAVINFNGPNNVIHECWIEGSIKSTFHIFKSTSINRPYHICIRVKNSGKHDVVFYKDSDLEGYARYGDVFYYTVNNIYIKKYSFVVTDQHKENPKRFDLRPKEAVSAK